MAIANTFDAQTTQSNLQRLEKLQYNTKPLWGKMNAPQVLAHLNVSYDMANEKITVKNSFVMKLILKTFIKKIVTDETPYKKNAHTPPVFVISNERDFEKEKALFIKNILETTEKGASHYEGKVSVSFGALTSKQWSNMFQKHLEHHFAQFGI